MTIAFYLCLSLAEKRRSFVLAKIKTWYQTIKLLHQCRPYNLLNFDQVQGCNLVE